MILFIEQLGDEHYLDKYELGNEGIQYSKWIIMDMLITWITFICCYNLKTIDLSAAVTFIKYYGGVMYKDCTVR